MVSSHVLPGILNGPGCDVDLAGQTLAVPANAAVNVYSLDAFQQLAALRTHTTAVVAARYIKGAQLLTASTDGQLAIWSTESWTLVGTYAFSGSIHSLVVASDASTAHVVVHDSTAAAARVRFYDLAAHAQLKTGIKLSSAGILARSADGACVALADRRRAIVWQGKQQRDAVVRPLVIKHTKSLTCVALSPDASSLAVGDVSGRISIWNNCLRAVIAAADSQQQHDDTVLSHPNVVHWHAKAVCALAFSLDSLSLLSGGHEAVLVTWQLATNARSFIANMPERIDSILPIDSFGASYVVANANTTLSQVNVATGEQLPLAAGLLPPPSRQGLGAGPIHRPGHYGQLLLASELPSLEIFDYAHGRTENVLRRRVNDMSEEGQQQPRCLLSLSGDGLCLVTLDVHEADESATQSSAGVAVLQTWQYVAKLSVFQPLSATHLPNIPRITSLAHHPLEAELAVGRSNGELRILRAAGLSWVPRCVLRTSGAAVGSLAFSADGSLLASATAEQLDIFDVLNGTLQFSLPCALPVSHVLPSLQVDFTVDGLLVATAATGDSLLHVSVWNLLTRQVAWTARLPARSVAVGVHSSLIAFVGYSPAQSPAANTSTEGAPMDGKATESVDAILQLHAHRGQPLAAWRSNGASMSAAVFKDMREGSGSAEASAAMLAFSKAMAWQDLAGAQNPQPMRFEPVKAPKQAAPGKQPDESVWRGQLSTVAGRVDQASHELGAHVEFARDSLLHLTVAE